MENDNKIETNINNIPQKDINLNKSENKTGKDELKPILVVQNEINKKEESKESKINDVKLNSINKNNDKTENKIPIKIENKSSSDENIKADKIDVSNKEKNLNLEVKDKVKPVKEIPIEKKPFNEFINDHLIPEIKREFKNRGKNVVNINLTNTNRPISDDICWVIYCEVADTCNFWLSFEKEDITSLKSFSLCKNYEKPSILESFLIDEKRITMKLIISRILQRLNGQKLIGAN